MRGVKANFFKKVPFLGGSDSFFKKKNIIFIVLGGSRPVSEFLGGVCNLFCKIRGGQYFAAEGRKIEGPPPWRCFWQLPLVGL